MNFEFDKCKIISFHNKYAEPILFDYKYTDKHDNIKLFNRVESISDLGIVFDS